MSRKPLALAPVRPNAGAEALYRRRLKALIDEMNDSVASAVLAEYRDQLPEIRDVPTIPVAADELPSAALKRVLAAMARRWTKRFNDAAPELAAYFAQKAARRSAKQLERILDEAGFVVRFKMTAAARDAMNATIAEQVGLIKSIPAQYLKSVEGDVMRSVALGRDLEGLTKDLRDNYGVTKRRAAFIARDQNNKATATMTRVRQLELGVGKAIWVHSGGGKEPRPTHLAAGRRKQVYDVAEGWFDPDADGEGKGRHIHPGELINCRCVSRPLIEGFS